MQSVAKVTERLIRRSKYFDHPIFLCGLWLCQLRSYCSWEII